MLSYSVYSLRLLCYI